MYSDGYSITAGQMYGARRACCGTQRCQIPLGIQYTPEKALHVSETITFKAVKSPVLEGYYLIPAGRKIY